MISAAPTRATLPLFDPERVRADFPALDQQVNGKPLVYLDSAATALKPQSVIDAVVNVYARDCANIHRGVHTLSQRATDSYEGARELVRGFINAPKREEVIFVRSTTEAINLVAQTYGRAVLREGDEVLITELEHHSNIVPWQMVTDQTGAKLVVVPITDEGEVSLEAFKAALGSRTKIAAFAHVSNALGTVLPIVEMTRLAHDAGAVVLIDGAQSTPHLRVDVQAIGCDFLAFSGHKLYGPTGVGILWGREQLLDAMPPYQGGGDMIDRVTFERTTWNDLPYKFEGGTPHISGAVGLGAAVQYLQQFGMDALEAHERVLFEYGQQVLSEVPGLRIIGGAAERVSVLPFVMEGAHPNDIGEIVDQHGIAIRTGHHCAQPVMDRFDVPATARASLGLYNTRSDLDALVVALRDVSKLLG